MKNPSRRGGPNKGRRSNQPQQQPQRKPGGRGGSGQQGGGGGRYPQRPGGYRPPQNRPPRDDDHQHHPEPAAHGGPRTPIEGVLEMHPKGYGFLRSPAKGYAPQSADAYVPAQLVSKFSLREGWLIGGEAEAARGTSGPRLVDVTTIEGLAPDQMPRRTFDDLTPIDPHQRITLETGELPMTTRVMDLLTPIGKGQRGLIVAPPRTGKTVLLHHIAQAVADNHPEMHLIMLLIDERPEEVTEMRRTVRGEVVASSSDRDTASHVRTAELVMERAKRLAEHGKQVFVLLDSITRLARAYNKSVGNSGRTLSGGVDSRAMEVPRRLFGNARMFEEGGSLTIMATALIETGSRMDDYIFQEFKGTGNMELVLDRRLADRRVYPAIDILQSGTRKEERILPAEVLKASTALRRTMASMHPVAAMEMLVKKLGEYPSNDAFVAKIATAMR
jgi:transcription termination factor Rho